MHGLRIVFLDKGFPIFCLILRFVHVEVLLVSEVEGGRQFHPLFRRWCWWCGLSLRIDLFPQVGQHSAQLYHVVLSELIRHAANILEFGTIPTLPR